MTHQQLTRDEQSAKACMMGTIDSRYFAPIITMGAFIFSLWRDLRRREK
jgi:hypothetical protein